MDIELMEILGFFKKFERGNVEGIRGSGLGLAIVERIVDFHNGKVWVENNEPRGSIFFVKLPKSSRSKSNFTSPKGMKA
ncbi:MAG: sensor histidine kinase [Candidatus Methanofastidiosia archaeon]